MLHRNAKLGLAGRLRAGAGAIEHGLLADGRRRPPSASRRRPPARWCAALARRRATEERTHARLPARSLEPAAADARACSRLASSARICAARRRTGWGPRLIAGATGHPHSTVCEGAAPPRAPRGRRVRRVSPPAATSGPAPATSCTWTPSATRASHGPATPSPASAPHRAPRRERAWGYEYAHSIVDDHSRLAYTELHARRARQHRHRLPRASTRFLRRATGSRPRRLMTDNAWCYTQEPRPARAARRTRDPPPEDPSRAAANERQGRALPPDAEARMGATARATAQLDHRARRPATLAALLQRAQTAQLARRPTTDQPRSQRLSGRTAIGRVVVRVR